MATTATTRSRQVEEAEAATEWPDFRPQVGSASGPLGAAQAADREMVRAFAARARALAEFARSRPASVDRAQGEPGAMSAQRWATRPEVLKPFSEWLAQETSIALCQTQRKAEDLVVQAITLVDRLPGVLAALEGGLLHLGHLPALEELVAKLADDRLRAEVEAELLRWVAERAAKHTITAPPQLRDKVLRVLAKRNARDAAQRALEALRDRGVYRQRERGEGLAGLGVVGTVAEVEALHAALGAYVDALAADAEDIRTRDQKMLAVLLDLVLRPGECDLPPVQVALTLVAGVQTLFGGDAPAELNGQVVSAETARQLLNALTGTALGADALAQLARVADIDTEGSGVEGAGDDTTGDDTTGDDTTGDDTTAPTPVENRFIDDPGWDEAEWTPRMRAARAAWEADWERRLFAGEFDDPDPMPPEAVLASAEQRLASGEVDLELGRLLAEAQDRWWAEFEAGRLTDPDPGDDPPQNGSPPATGWWAAADRALAEASDGQREAEQLLARAERRVRTAAMADAADENAWRQSCAGRSDRAGDALSALRVAAVADRAALHDLLARTGGGLAERPRIALVDALSGVLLSLTDLAGLRQAAHCGRPACRRRPDRCDHDLTGRPGLGAPGPTAGYRPGRALDGFVRARDRRCRFPGCRRPVAKGELDHRIRYPDGPTDATNLAGFCVGHHRGKHQAPGWTYELDLDGTLTVTTPTGLTATTAPPPY